MRCVERRRVIHGVFINYPAGGGSGRGAATLTRARQSAILSRMVTERNEASEAPMVDPGLHWRIKDSFVQYVLRGADGVYSVTDGAADDGMGNFYFPVARVINENDSWELSFRGEVRFRGHGGVLFVPVANPTVRLSRSGGWLSVGRSRSGEEHTTIAELDGVSPVAVGEAFAWPPLVPRLTADGVSLFGGAYNLGSPLEPVRMIIPAS